MITDEVKLMTPIPFVGKSNFPNEVIDLNTPQEYVKADLAEAEDLIR